MLTRICGCCGAIVVQGEKCKCIKQRYKEYDKEHRNKKAADFYHSKSWRLLQQAASSRANYIDEYIARYEHRIEPGRIAHHIIPIDDDMSHALTPKNIVYVSAKTHKLIHDAYSKSEKDKKEMQARLAMIRMDD